MAVRDLEFFQGRVIVKLDARDRVILERDAADLDLFLVTEIPDQVKARASQAGPVHDGRPRTRALEAQRFVHGHRLVERAGRQLDGIAFGGRVDRVLDGGVAAGQLLAVINFNHGVPPSFTNETRYWVGSFAKAKLYKDCAVEYSAQTDSWLTL